MAERPADQVGSPAAERRGWFVALTVALALAIAGLLLTTRFADSVRWVRISSTVGFTFVAAGLWLPIDRLRRSDPADWDRYETALAASLGMYVIGVALMQRVNLPWFFWIPYASLSAVPLLVAAGHRHRRPHSTRDQVD